MKTNQLKGGINLNDSRGNPLWLPNSLLPRKDRGSHPVLGPGLKQRGQQRENVGANRELVWNATSCKPLVVAL